MLGTRHIACATFDFRGFGTAPGPRGHVDRFEDYLEDLDAAVDAARRLAGDTPLFLLGHSMGGLAAIRWVQTRPGVANHLAGLVLSSPFLAMPKPLSALVRLAIACLSRIRPKHRFQGSGKPNTRDEAITAAHKADPLAVPSLTARWLREALGAQRAALRDASEVRLPLLTLQAGADTATDPSVTVAFHEATGSAAKRVEVYEDYLHEVLNELPDARARVHDDLANWLTSRV